eukprot:COSAG02_NODE_107_length_36312_cov_45.037942_18_plen_100_part_00
MAGALLADGEAGPRVQCRCWNRHISIYAAFFIILHVSQTDFALCWTCSARALASFALSVVFSCMAWTPSHAENLSPLIIILATAVPVCLLGTYERGVDN